MFLKTYNTELDKFVIKLTDQNGRLLYIEDNFDDFVNIYKDYTKEPYSFLVNDATFFQIIH